jgi:peptidoglycan/xylan/chitin deacetylase (PgdA/CDA1 family)
MTTPPPPNPRIPFALSTDLPALPPFRGQRLIVNVAVNVEHWPFDRPMPRSVLPPPHGAPGPVPDVPNFTWVEHGLRAGMPRLLELCRHFGLKASSLSNATICTHYPRLAEAMLRAGWEFVGHGLYQRSLAAVEDEEAWVAESLSIMRGFSGQPVRAWLGPGMGETPRSPEVLRRNGVLYLHDWLVEEVPVWMRTEAGAMLALPYTVELNDVPVFSSAAQASTALLDRIRATLAFHARTGGFDRTTRVMTIALHPHVIGVPHRMEPLWTAFEELAAHPEVVFATSSEIGDWYAALHPAPAWAQGGG